MFSKVARPSVMRVPTAHMELSVYVREALLRSVRLSRKSNRR